MILNKKDCCGISLKYKEIPPRDRTILRYTFFSRRKNMLEQTALTPVVTVLWVLAGILLSLILPLAVKSLSGARLEANQPPPTFWEKLKVAWEKYGGKKYSIILLCALLVAVVIVFLFNLKFYAVRDAVLAGFAWESFVNKLYPKKD
jgi:hypothetical protein